MSPDKAILVESRGDPRVLGDGVTVTACGGASDHFADRLVLHRQAEAQLAPKLIADH